MKTPIPSSKKNLINDEQVKQFLESHPDFFNLYPDLLAQMNIPSEWDEKDDDRLVDFRAKLIAHLQNKIAIRDAEHHHLMGLTRINSHYQNRIHHLILQILRCDSLQKLLQMLKDDMPQALELEKIVLCLVPDKDNRSGLQDIGFDHLRIVSPQFLAILDGEPVQMRAHIQAESEIYDEMKIHSDILIAVNFDKCKGFLAFGSKRPENFDSAQSPDLMLFLSHIFEIKLQSYLRGD